MRIFDKKVPRRIQSYSTFQPKIPYGHMAVADWPVGASTTFGPSRHPTLRFGFFVTVV
jgi:hypothetical protein